MKQTNPFGVNTVDKVVTVPYKNAVIYNPKGRAFFQPLGGNWSATPVSYDYIFSGDAINTVAAQVTSDYETVPFTVSGTTTSRLSELQQYGSIPYIIGVPVIQGNQILGAVTNINPVFTGYTIQGVDYYDYVNGETIYFEGSSGFTPDNITARTDN